MAGAPRFWQSLRWRLPFLTSGLLALVFLALLWVAYRQLEFTLREAAGERARFAAEQFAALFAQTAQQRLAELRRVAASAVIAEPLENPSPTALAAARAALSPLIAGSGFVQLFTDTHELVISIGDAAPVRILPNDPAIVAEGHRPLQERGGKLFADTVVPVTGPRSGYLVSRRLVAVSPGPDMLNRLVGSHATIEIGNRAGDVWTDLTLLVPAPPIDLTATGVASYVRPDGEQHVGALAHIAGTPWAVWVAFPHDVLVAPARAFLRRTIAAAVLFVLVAIAVARIVTGRALAPLSHITRAADAIAAGDYSHRVERHLPDEIGRLADAFNTMSDQVARDFAARQVAEAALRDREVSSRTLFAGNPLPMWVYDTVTLRFLEVNNAAIERYGYSRDEFLAMRITDIRPQEDVPRLLATVAGERDPFQRAGLWRHRLKSGAVIDVEIVSHTLTFEERAAILVVAQDVTERKQLEDQLRQAQKMEAVGKLAGGIAHDFNNLLTAILGYSNLLLAEVPADFPNRRDIEEIRRAGESAGSLTRQLLAFSRRQILQPQVLDLNDVVRRMESLLKRLIGEDIDLDTRLSPSLDRVSADPGQIEQIIMNLAVNARDAMPAGGRLTVETATVVLDSTYAAKHAGSSPGPHVMLAVSDTGTGIDAPTMERIFEPFFTTKKRGEGTGLGLATVYGIVKQSGGSIWVYSEPNQGATFKVYLPVTTERAARPVVAARPAALQGTETILVAEDQAEVRSVVRTVLSRHGYTVLEAVNGEDALRVLGQYTRPIHLLLTDVVMPALSGRELVQQLQRSHPAIKVVYASGYTDDAIVRHGVLEPGVVFIQKPFTPDALLRKVREALDG